MRTRPGWAETEVHFRVIRATADGRAGVLMATDGGKSVEITLGPPEWTTLTGR